MKLCQTSISLLEKTILKAIDRYIGEGVQNVVTDIHLQPNSNSGELSVYNDDDDMLAQAVIEEWVGYEGENFEKNVERILNNLLAVLKEQGRFDKLTIMKPYSFVLVDEEKETIADLLLVDDDTLLVNDELLKGLDEELDAFLKDLLEQ